MQKMQKCYFVEKCDLEFGWELFAWQGYLRRFSKSCKEMIVCCKKGHDLLYKDFSTEIIHDNKNIKNYEIIKKIEQNELFKKYKPAYYLCTNINNMKFKKIINTQTSKHFEQQDFIKFGKYKEGIGYDIVLHGRNRNHRKACNFETGIKIQINKFIENNKKLKVCSIGSFEESILFENTEDLRGINLEDLSDILYNSKVIVGPSSGPIHFASLCGCYQIVWSDNYNNRERYIKDWNPFKTGVSFIWKHPYRMWKKEIMNEIKNKIK